MLPLRTAEPPPSRRHGGLFFTLFLVIVLTVGGLNARYLFRAELHEHGDLAANSLAIREAKRFQRLYGQYSRWGFSHPGPGWFYAMAGGEALFYDALRLTPTPLNAQLLVVLLINGAFLAAAVGIVAREAAAGEKGRRAVLATAAGAGLVVTVLHLAVLGSSAGLLYNWTACLMVLPFTCLVVAAASVGAGRGGDLPVLALAGAALLHSHVAQPLFVVPLVGLAWVGLCWSESGRPWRAFPRAHALAAAVVLLTALPVALDAMKGSASNLALILAHRRAHAGEGHGWLDALFYCLRFAGYKPNATGEEFFRGRATWAALGGYLSRNAAIFTVWALAAGLLAAGAWRNRFGRCLLASVTLAAGLAVHWARVQDGALLYFNSWFLNGLLLALALGAVAAGVQGFAAAFPRVARTPWPAVGLVLLAAGLFAARAQRFRSTYGEDENSRNLARSVGAALAEDAAGRGRTKYLAFPGNLWEDAVGVALELARRGERYRVGAGGDLIFGAGTAPADPREGLRAPDALHVWRILPASVDPEAAARRPLFYRNGLSLEPPAVDPAAGTVIAFSGPQPNAAAYFLTGWSAPAPGDPYTWSERPLGLMAFRAVPVPAPGAEVEIVVDAFPAVTPGLLEARRLELTFNDHPLGQWTVRRDESIRVRVPGAVWNARPEAMLEWRFPDAVSPAQLGRGNDGREIAFGFRAVRFALVAR